MGELELVVPAPVSFLCSRRRAAAARAPDVTLASARIFAPLRCPGARARASAGGACSSNDRDSARGFLARTGAILEIMQPRRWLSFSFFFFFFSLSLSLPFFFLSFFFFLSLSLPFFFFFFFFLPSSIISFQSASPLPFVISFCALLNLRRMRLIA